MIFTRANILRAVRVRLGYDPQPQPLFADVCDCSRITDRLILDTFIAAAAAAMNSCQVSLLSGIAHPIADSDIFWTKVADNRYTGKVMLPADFMRMMPLRMSQWSRAAYLVDESSPLALRLMTLNHPAFSGNVSRPVCRVEHTERGVLLYFAACTSTSARIEQGAYVTYPRFDSDGGINLPIELFPDILDDTVKRFTA